jgi:hypothetical protein
MTGGPHNQRQYELNGALTRFLVVSPEKPPSSVPPPPPDSLRLNSLLVPP